MIHTTNRSRGGGWAGLLWQLGVLVALLELSVLVCALPVNGSEAGVPRADLATPEQATIEASHGVSIVLPERTIRVETPSGASRSAVRLLMALCKATALLLVDVRTATLLGLGVLLLCVVLGVMVTLLTTYILLMARPVRVSTTRPCAQGASQLEDKPVVAGGVWKH